MNNLQNNSENSPAIMVCIDTSNASASALKYACYKAKSLGFSVHILAVLESSHKNLLFGSKAIGNQKRNQLDRHLQKLIDDICGSYGIVPAVSVREGEITTEITRELKLIPGCRLLVFGKSHNNLSDNTVLPKIVGKIGNKIPLPVVIVPENLSDDLIKL